MIVEETFKVLFEGRPIYYTIFADICSDILFHKLYLIISPLIDSTIFGYLGSCRLCALIESFQCGFRDCLLDFLYNITSHEV